MRELENVIERAVVLTNERSIKPEHLMPAISTKAAADLAGLAIPGSPISEIERVAILRTIESVEGSTSRAAAILGMSPRKVQYRLREYREAGILSKN